MRFSYLRPGPKQEHGYIMTIILCHIERLKKRFDTYFHLLKTHKGVTCEAFGLLICSISLKNKSPTRREFPHQTH